jgi:hypothetical protein
MSPLRVCCRPPKPQWYDVNHIFKLKEMGIMNPVSSPSLTIHQGTCYALFAYDIGLSINLEEAERRITAGTERGRLRHKARAPQYFEYRPAPL